MTLCKKMSYDIEVLELACATYHLPFVRISIDEIEITLAPDCFLQFANLPDEDDTYVGFKGTPWHSHGNVMFMTSTNTCIECSEIEIIELIAAGILLIVTQLQAGELKDRWLSHREEPLDLRDLQPNDELRIKQRA